MQTTFLSETDGLSEFVVRFRSCVIMLGMMKHDILQLRISMHGNFNSLFW